MEDPAPQYRPPNGRPASGSGRAPPSPSTSSQTTDWGSVDALLGSDSRRRMLRSQQVRKEKIRIANDERKQRPVSELDRGFFRENAMDKRAVRGEKVRQGMLTVGAGLCGKVSGSSGREYVGLRCEKEVRHGREGRL